MPSTDDIDHKPGTTPAEFRAPEILVGDAAATRVAERVVELTAFLVDHLGVTEVGASSNATATLHPSCHGLCYLGLGPQAECLLDGVEGLTRCELEGSIDNPSFF